jgi:gp32 DNA binding protein like
MALNFAQIKEKLQAQQANKDKMKNGAGGDNASYPFWSNPDGSTAVLRFLPDGDDSNDFFWQERLIIRLPFTGIKGDISSKPFDIQVPCMDMWKPGSCPISAEIRPWWKGGTELEEMARKYYRKKTYLFQGFVVQNPNPEDIANAPENPIRRFIISTSVFDRIKTVFMDQEVENSPVEYDNGLDFRLAKGSKGGFSDYGSSSWARKERSLNENERAAIEKYGLWQLNQFLPKKPDEDHLRAIMDMFRDSVDGKPYDGDRYSQYYRPYGYKNDNDTSQGGNSDIVKTVTGGMTRTAAQTDAAFVEAVDPPFDGGVPAKTASSSDTGRKATSPDEILAAILKRKNAAS